MSEVCQPKPEFQQQLANTKLSLSTNQSNKQTNTKLACGTGGVSVPHNTLHSKLPTIVCFCKLVYPALHFALFRHLTLLVYYYPMPIPHTNTPCPYPMSIPHAHTPCPYPMRIPHAHTPCPYPIPILPHTQNNYLVEITVKS